MTAVDLPTASAPGVTTPPAPEARSSGPERPVGLRIYVACLLTIALGALALAPLVPTGDTATFAQWFISFIVVALAAQVGSTPLQVGKATGSVAFVPFLAAILIAGPGWAMLIAGLTQFVAEAIARKPWIKLVHNTAKEVVAIGLAGWVYGLFGTVPTLTTGEFSISFIGFIPAAIVYSTFNQASTSVVIALSGAMTFRHVWKRLANVAATNEVMAASLAILLTFLYMRLEIVGLLVVMIPLFFIRHAYAMNVRLAEVNRELRVSDEASRNVLEVSPAAIFVHSDGQIVYSNPAAMALLSADDPAWLKGRAPAEFILTMGSASGGSRQWPSLGGLAVQALEGRMKRFDGEIIDVEAAEIPFTYRGKPATQLIVHDVTARKKAEEERRQMEAQMQQAQKLESLGVLAGGIAHDFNNLLVGVLGNASLVADTLPDGSTEKGMVEQIEKAALRASELTNQMLAYSGKGGFVIARTNLNELIEEMSKLLEASITKRAEIVYEFSMSLPLVEVDATQVRQVVMNLITNAAESLHGKGTIIIRTGVIQVDQQYLADAYLPDDLAEGQYIFLEVEDNGRGMDQDTKAKIFDPFFTTKFAGRGLGLASVLGIVRSHGGTIKLESAPGYGTKFTVLLSASEAVATPRTDAARPGELAGTPGQGMILVVDDEEPVRAVAKTMLEKFGFDVVVAADGREGINRFREYRHDIVVALLDVAMPRMNGEETLEGIHRVDPSLPVVLMSGFAEDDIVRRFHGHSVAGFLQKPFSAAGLKKKLTEVLRTYRGRSPGHARSAVG